MDNRGDIWGGLRILVESVVRLISVTVRIFLSSPTLPIFFSLFSLLSHPHTFAIAGLLGIIRCGEEMWPRQR